MNEHTQSLSGMFSKVLIGVIVLALILLFVIGPLSGKAALQSFGPEAITNPQKAAILGGQHLLRSGQIFYFVYLPALSQ